MSREQTERMLVDVRKRVRKQKSKTWTIDPVRCREAQWWDAVICLALVYTALVPPAEVAFTPPQKKVKVNALFCINQVVNFVFFADMILQFFLHVQLPKHKGGVWIRNHKKIIKRYLKGAFFVDFVSIIPFSALTFTGIKIFNNLQMARLLRLLRLMKLLRMFRGSRLIMRYRASMTLSITGANLIGFIIFTVLASHWLACTWGFLGNQIGRDRNSWMAPFLEPDYLKGKADEEEWFSPSGLPVPWDVQNPQIQYLMCLYFTLTTLTTVGYGDVHARNVAERAVVSVMMLCGGLMWAWIIGAVTQAVTTLDVKKIQYNQIYDQINWMLLDLGVDARLCRDSREFLLNSVEIQRRLEYSRLIQHLSPDLRCKVCENVFSHKLNVVPYFRHTSQLLRLGIFERLTHLLFAPDEVILRRKTLMIIENHGYIGCQGRLYMRGQPVFLDFLTADEDPPPRALALKFTEVSALTRSALDAACADNPNDTYRITKARVYYGLLKLAREIIAYCSELEGLSAKTHCGRNSRKSMAKNVAQQLVAHGHSPTQLRRLASHNNPRKRFGKAWAVSLHPSAQVSEAERTDAAEFSLSAPSSDFASALDALRKTSLTEEQARLVSRLAETLEPPKPAGPDAAQIYMVPARVAGGAIVREGVELDSPLVATCPPGTALTITGEGTAANGTQRLRVSQPVAGWVSTKSVDFVAPPPTPTLKAAPSTPRRHSTPRRARESEGRPFSRWRA